MFCRDEPRALRALFQTHIEQSIKRKQRVIKTARRKRFHLPGPGGVAGSVYRHTVNRDDVANALLWIVAKVFCLDCFNDDTVQIERVFEYIEANISEECQFEIIAGL